MRDKKNKFYRSSAFPVAVAVSLAGVFIFFAKYIDPCCFAPASLLPLLSLPVLLFLLITTIILACKRNYLFVITLAVMLLNLESFVPYLKIFHKGEFPGSKSSSSLTIASYNVHEFNRMNYTESLSDISSHFLKRGVDIICFQEYETPPMLNEQESEEVFRMFPYKHIVKKSLYGNGMAIFSRYPITASGKIAFERSSNGVVWADVKFGDSILRVLNLHLQTTGYNHLQGKDVFTLYRTLMYNSCIRATQAGIVRKFADTSKVPLIIAGDFNDTYDSYVMRQIRGELKDAFLESGAGLPCSLKGLFCFLRIDYILFPKEFKCERSLYDKVNWSDHYPVIAELEYQNRK